MFDRITPPKIVPNALVSFGSSRSLMAGIRSVIEGSFYRTVSTVVGSNVDSRLRRDTIVTSDSAIETRPKSVYHESHMSTLTNGRRRRPRLRRQARRRRARGASTTPASSTRCRAGATATSRSTRPATSQVHPTKEPARAIDLKELVDRLQLRGIGLPVLVRFTDILHHRLGEIHAAFQGAIAQNQYQGGYSCVYPIKVNQQRQVVEEVLNFGKPYRFGLEAGSKPELLAVVALADNDTPIICNGFKDAEFIETAMLAQKIGRNIIPVVEKYTELGLILEAAEKVGVRPQIGMRVKLAARGSGRWQSSGGFRSKFGLTVTEIMRGLEELKTRGMQDCLKLLHFHLGSQITNIRIVKGALNEAARVYTELARLGAGLQYLDVGGGLGVDYDGSQTNFESSMNYTLEEYANDVVYHIQTVCDEAGVPHPTIISESGRAVVAYHSVLVFNVLGVSGFGDEKVPDHRQPGLGAAARRPDRDLQQRHGPQRARGVPRRAAGARHGAEPVHRRLPAARAAQHGREPVLGDLHQAPEDRPDAGRGARRICRTSTSSCRTPTSATSRCSSRFPTAGRSSSSSR